MKIFVVEAVTGGHVPVLWITGPAGVGKSTVAWQIFTELAQAGTQVAFADADQFCMCYPAPPEDPTRERIKAQNVGALVARYRAAGARCVIVSGCLDPVGGVRSELITQGAVTVCRLRADPDEVVRRYADRERKTDGLDELLEETRAEAEAMDASDFADVCVDTTGVTAAEVARLVRDSCRDWPGFNVSPLKFDDDPSGDDDIGDVGGTILLICGPTGVGKSTVGFELYLRYLRDGLTAGYVDLDQIAFVRPAPEYDPGSHRLKAGNLAAMWGTYRSAGATHLIATGQAANESALQAYIGALPAAKVTVCRLHAGPAELTRRIMSRGEGGSWPQPGDPLRGRSADDLRRVADQAIVDARALDHAGVGNFCVDTDGRTVAESAELIFRWLASPTPRRASGCRS